MLHAIHSHHEQALIAFVKAYCRCQDYRKEQHSPSLGTILRRGESLRELKYVMAEWEPVPTECTCKLCDEIECDYCTYESIMSFLNKQNTKVPY